MANDKFIKYVILLSKVTEFTPETVNEHVEYLRMLDKKCQLVMCGPFLDYSGLIIIVCAESIDEAELIAKNEPFVKKGIKKYEIRTMIHACEENNFLLEKNSTFF